MRPTCFPTGLLALSLHCYVSGLAPLQHWLSWLRARLRRLTSVKKRLMTSRLVVSLTASRASLLSSVVHAAFYSHNDFACCSNNKWLYVFIPVR